MSTFLHPFENDVADTTYTLEQVPAQNRKLLTKFVKNRNLPAAPLAEAY